MRIGWAITGAGHFLLESVEVLEKVAEDHEVTVLLSAAGQEVLQMYGLFNRVKSVTGGYYRELVPEKEQRFSYPITGRFSMGKYDILVVSPTTANTISKLVNGIADTLVTNAVAQAGKGLIPTLIIPVDMKSGVIQTVLPSKLELDLCQGCDTCLAAAACPNDAITPGVEINLLKCEGCGECYLNCPFGAVSGGKKIRIHMRDIDIRNTERLKDITGISVLNHPNEIMKELLELKSFLK